MANNYVCGISAVDVSNELNFEKRKMLIIKGMQLGKSLTDKCNGCAVKVSNDLNQNLSYRGKQ